MRGLEIGWLDGLEYRYPSLRRDGVGGRVRSVPRVARLERIARKAVSRARRNPQLVLVRETLERQERALQDTQAQLQAMTAAAPERELASIEVGVRKIEALVDAAQGEVSRGLKGMRGRLEWVSDATTYSGDRVGALIERIDVLQTKHEALAMEMRERVPVQPAADELPSPVIVDRDARERCLSPLLACSEWRRS